MRSSFLLGRILGIPIRISYTWFLIFALVAASLAALDFPLMYPDHPVLLYWALGIVGSLRFFGSVLAPELAHSVVARAQGVAVRDITLFLFGGVSSIEEDARRPRDEFFMAAVGPGTSVLLTVLFALLGSALDPVRSLVGGFFLRLAFVNAGLALFNLLPGLPLDGGRILRSLLWGLTGSYRQASRWAAVSGRVISFLLIGSGLYIALRFPANWISGLWLVFIGWFMDNAAVQSYQQSLLQDVLRQVTAGELMTASCAPVSRNLSVSELVNGHILSGGRRCFIVNDGETFSGLLTVHNVGELPRERWESTLVGEIMLPYAGVVLVHPDEDAWTALQRMDEQNVNQMPVEQGGRILGMLARENLLRYIRRQAELGA